MEDPNFHTLHLLFQLHLWQATPDHSRHVRHEQYEHSNHIHHVLQVRECCQDIQHVHLYLVVDQPLHVVLLLLVCWGEMDRRGRWREVLQTDCLEVQVMWMPLSNCHGRWVTVFISLFIILFRKIWLTLLMARHQI